VFDIPRLVEVDKLYSSPGSEVIVGCRVADGDGQPQETIDGVPDLLEDIAELGGTASVIVPEVVLQLRGGRLVGVVGATTTVIAFIFLGCSICG
jgi:hypothetical protein